MGTRVRIVAIALLTVAVAGSTRTFSNSRTSRQSLKAPISSRLPRNTLPSSPSSNRIHSL